MDQDQAQSPSKIKHHFNFKGRLLLLSLLQNRVEETFAHSNVSYHHNSLESKMSLIVKKVSKVNENMQASGDWLDWARDTHLPGEEDICDLYHYMTVASPGGYIGVAQLGAVCVDDIGYRAGITGLYEVGSPAENDAELALVRIFKELQGLEFFLDFRFSLARLCLMKLDTT